jgi:hypothetical protein
MHLPLRPLLPKEHYWHLQASERLLFVIQEQTHQGYHLPVLENFQIHLLSTVSPLEVERKTEPTRFLSLKVVQAVVRLSRPANSLPRDIAGSETRTDSHKALVMVACRQSQHPTKVPPSVRCRVLPETSLSVPLPVPLVGRLVLRSMLLRRSAQYLRLLDQRAVLRPLRRWRCWFDIGTLRLRGIFLWQSISKRSGAISFQRWINFESIDIRSTEWLRLVL